MRAIAAESRRVPRPVYLFNGDSHVYNGDRPLAAGSSWLAFYGVTTPVDKLQRITVDGSDNNNDYLRVSVNRGGRTVLAWGTGSVPELNPLGIASTRRAGPTPSTHHHRAPSLSNTVIRSSRDTAAEPFSPKVRETKL